MPGSPRGSKAGISGALSLGSPRGSKAGISGALSLGSARGSKAGVASGMPRSAEGATNFGSEGKAFGSRLSSGSSKGVKGAGADSALSVLEGINTLGRSVSLDFMESPPPEELEGEADALCPV